MQAIDRYLFRTTFGTFLLVAGSLTLLVWITQALREIDLITSQSQTIFVFFGITAMLIPMLLLVTAPVALVVALVFTLRQLNQDSELTALTAASVSPWRLFRPFLLVALVVVVIVAVISAYLAPLGMRELRNSMTRVRADVLTNIVQPGHFFQVGRGLIIQIRERRLDGGLVDVFVDDQRDADERTTLMAERGEILKTDTGVFLLLQNGSIQRQESRQRDPTIVVFDRYAFDLSQFASNNATAAVYTASERFPWELWSPDPNDPAYRANPARYRSELHDRLLAPIYPLAFAVIAFLLLGAPRTTRQSQGLALTIAVVAVAGLRLTGFAMVAAGMRSPVFLFIPYLLAFGTIIAGMFMIWRGKLIEPPAALGQAIETSVARLQRLFSPARKVQGA